MDTKQPLAGVVGVGVGEAVGDAEGLARYESDADGTKASFLIGSDGTDRG